MKEKQVNSSHQTTHFLSKTSSTRSCENLLCLTKRCNQDETKQKERILNNQYFQKLSLKKFNNSTLINHSFYEKDKGHERSLRRDKSTEDSEFQNIILNPHIQESVKYNSGFNIQSNAQFDQSRRIARSSSYRQLDRPQLKTTDRSISKQLEQDFRRIQDLQRLRNRLQTQIRQLDQNIDKYYHVYHSKLQQLKKIQSRMNEIGEEERMMKKVPSNDDLKSFKKKSFWEEFGGSKFIPVQKKVQNTDAYNTKVHYYKKTTTNFIPNNNISFVKKTI